jgi:hypothetical protein
MVFGQWAMGCLLDLEEPGRQGREAPRIPVLGGSTGGGLLESTRSSPCHDGRPADAGCAKMDVSEWGKAVANKDKGGAKNKKVASKTLKEKREAKKAKGASGSRGSDSSR